MKIPKIVLTGGPCAGKTTAKAYLSEKLTELGYYPIFVPEGASTVINAGIVPNSSACSLHVFQSGVVDMVISLEAQFDHIASHVHHPKPIIICDRGIMDSEAYMPKSMFDNVLRERGLDMSSARDARYLGVFHLRTAALGAEEFYTLGNNTARRETLAEAKEVDEATLKAWVGHPHVSIIGNEGRTFEQKLHHLWAKLCRVLGIPTPLEIERKYLVCSVDFSALPHYVTSEISQCYIQSDVDGEISRLRRRGVSGAYTYYHTKKREVRSGVRVETERLITRHEYEHLAMLQIPNTEVIEKLRHCFVYKDQYFELDVFQKPSKYEGLILLEIELTEEHDAIELPPWVDIAEDVTESSEYANFILAKG